MTNTIFNSNTASKYAGALYNFAKSKTTIDKCDWTYNKAGDRGGAIYVDVEDITFKKNKFASNVDNTYGLGIYFKGTISNIQDSKFSKNLAKAGGGAISQNLKTFKITNTLFNSNTANTYGGTLHNFDGSNTIISKCIWTYNTGYGENICSFSNIELYDSRFEKNKESSYGDSTKNGG